jgi:hypothetical protein
MSARRSFDPDRGGRVASDAAPALRPLLTMLVHGLYLEAVVPLALIVVERDPLATVGQFRGDLLRGLMEVPGGFWGRYPTLFDRYRSALRAAAALRRQLPHEARMQFWEPLDVGPRDECSSAGDAEPRECATPREPT